MLPSILLLALQAPPPPPPAYPGAAIDAHVRAGRYLAALDEAEHRMLAGEDELLLDLFGLVQSYVGLERETLETFDSMGAPPPAVALGSSPVDDAVALDAIPALVEAARGRRIVILNESHHMPRHRAFALELARALRAEGFDTFAAETFQDVAATEARGWPEPDTGYYTAEPVFGELVRGVLALGYRPVAYEWHPTALPGADARTRINTRETAQAQNLLERVFQVDPEARLLVHVGYSHATEDWRDPGGPGEVAWMAARLAKLTGLDPLTIDQTVALPRSEPVHEDPHWRRAEERGLLDGPKLLRRPDGAWVVVGSYAGKVDLQVFHPRTRPVHGRPDWLARGRRAVAVPSALAQELPGDERVLLQAFHAGESPRAIPADQFVLEPGTEPAHFLLVPGEYRLAVQDAGGRVLAALDGVRVE
ncbi:MAG TPA: hypothetical protein VF530_09170 [Planctomycetota bacterium]